MACLCPRSSSCVSDSLIVEHLGDEVEEGAVVVVRVAGLSCSPAARAPRAHTQDLGQQPGTGSTGRRHSCHVSSHSQSESGRLASAWWVRCWSLTCPLEPPCRWAASHRWRRHLLDHHHHGSQSQPPAPQLLTVSNEASCSPRRTDPCWLAAPAPASALVASPAPPPAAASAHVTPARSAPRFGRHWLVGPVVQRLTWSTWSTPPKSGSPVCISAMTQPRLHMSIATEYDRPIITCSASGGSHEVRHRACFLAACGVLRRTSGDR